MTIEDLEYAPDAKLNAFDDEDIDDTDDDLPRSVRCSINRCWCCCRKIRLSRKYCLCLAALIIVVGLGIMGTFIALYTTFMILWFA